MSIVIDFNLVCLICLQDDGGDLRTVYAKNGLNQKLTIAEKISRCSELSLEAQNTKLPDKICQSCLSDLQVAWRFRQNCKTANAVFRSIEHQDADAETVTNYELERQKIRLPSGLKIKKVQPEMKTYVLPVLEEEDNDGDDVVAGNEGGHDVEILNSEQAAENVEQDDKEVEEVEDQEKEEHIDQEGVDIDDYYEIEEILEDDDGNEGNDQNHDDNADDDKFIEEHLETVKVEKADEDLSPTAVTTKKKKACSSIGERKFKQEEEESEMDKQAESEQRQNSVKRKRGRPKKHLTTNSPTSLPASHIKTKSEKENIEENEKQSTSRAISTTKSKTITKPFKSLSTSGKHTKAHKHPPTKICEICGNVYKYQHALNAHMRRHTNDRPFSCEFCDKAFVSGVELRRHMRVHTGQKPYGCTYCDRRFSDFGSRIKHERTHTGERPYYCNTCGKSFAYAHVLSVHLRTHTGEKKFQCSRCGKGFTKKSYLLSHMEQHANADVMDVELDQLQQHHNQHQKQQPHQKQLKQQQLYHQILDSDVMAIKTVAMEECIFTTEYIEVNDEGDGNDDDDDEDGNFHMKKEKESEDIYMNPVHQEEIELETINVKYIEAGEQEEEHVENIKIKSEVI